MIRHGANDPPRRRVSCRLGSPNRAAAMAEGERQRTVECARGELGERPLSHAEAAGVVAGRGMPSDHFFRAAMASLTEG